MRTKLQLPEGTFHQLFEQLIARKGLKEILRAYGPAKRRPPQLKATELIKGLVFHVMQGGGKLAENMKRCTGKKISDSALSQRRQVMGVEVFEWLMEGALEVRAHPRKHPDAFYHDLRLIGVDGTRFSVSNSPQIVREMRKAESRRLKSAFAKVNACVMVELGLRNPIAAAVGLKNESEMELGREVLQSMPEDSLLIGDRLYGVGVPGEIRYNLKLRNRGNRRVGSLREPAMEPEILDRTDHNPFASIGVMASPSSCLAGKDQL